jgi:hypothetical protein
MAACSGLSAHDPSLSTRIAAFRCQYLAESVDSGLHRLRALMKATTSSGCIVVPWASSTQTAIRWADQVLGAPPRHASSRFATLSGASGDGRGSGCRLRGPETKAKCPEIGLLVVRVKSVEVSVSVDGRSSGLAVFERGEGAAEGGHPGLLEAGCRLLERDGLAPLEQRND